MATVDTSLRLPFQTATTPHQPIIRSDTWANYILSLNWCFPAAVHEVKKCLGLLSPLAKELDALAKSIPNFLIITDNQLKLIKDGFASEEFPRLRPKLNEIMTKASDENRNKILEALFDQIPAKEGSVLVRRLQQVLELQKIDLIAGAIKTQNDLYTDAKTAANMLSDEVSRRILEEQKEKQQTLVKTVLMYALHTFDWFISMIVQVLHLKDTSLDDADGLESHFEAEMRFQGLMEELQLLSGWLVALYLLVGSLTLTIMIVASITAVIATAAVIYFKWFKPPPENIRSWTNLTKQATLGRLNPVTGRDDIVDKILNQFMCNDSSAKRQIFLTGPTGVGKNEIINRLAQRIVAGQVPDMFKGNRLYQTHISDLLASGGDKPARWHLDKMSIILENHKKTVILSLDEGKVAFTPEENLSKIGEKLKQTLDFFSNCIITMTDEEYDRYVTDPAIIRRTIRIQAKALSQEDTELTLSEMAIREAPDLEVTNDALQLAAGVSKQEEFKNCPQPFTSKDILATAFSKARTPKYRAVIKEGEEDDKATEEDVEETLNQLKKCREALEMNHLLKHGKERLPYTREGRSYHTEITTLNRKINIRETFLNEAKRDYEDYLELIKLRNELENATNLLALRIQSDKDKAKVEALQRFILNLHYLLPSIEVKIDNQGKKLKGIKTVVTKEMIEDIIKEKIRELHELKMIQEQAKQRKKEEEERNFDTLRRLLRDVLKPSHS